MKARLSKEDETQMKNKKQLVTAGSVEKQVRNKGDGKGERRILIQLKIRSYVSIITAENMFEYAAFITCKLLNCLIKSYCFSCYCTFSSTIYL